MPFLQKISSLFINFGLGVSVSLYGVSYLVNKKKINLNPFNNEWLNFEFLREGDALPNLDLGEYLNDYKTFLLSQSLDNSLSLKLGKVMPGTKIANNLKNFSSKTDFFKNSDFKDLDKNRIPYEIKDEEIISKFKEKLPIFDNNSNNSYFYTEILKDNEAGKITINVIEKRFHYWTTFNQYISNKKVLQTYVIDGFKTMNNKDIISERVLRVFINGLPYKYKKYRKINYDHYWKNMDNFYSVGSSFIFKKDTNLPKYYILTNKHLFSDNNDVLIGYSQKEQKNINTHIVNYVNLNNDIYNGELKGIVSFGNAINSEDEKLAFQKLKPEEYIKNEYYRPYEDLQSKYLLEKKNPNINIVKSIKFVKDLSNVYVEKSNEKIIYHTNENYNSLSNIKNMDEKITLDAVILSIEFIDEQHDPFFSWWKQRPTNYRSLKVEDFLSHKFISALKDIEINKTIKDTENVYAAGFDSKNVKKFCQDPLTKVTDLSISKGSLSVTTTRYFNNLLNRNSNRYIKNSFDSNIYWKNKNNLLLSGSSGGPIFDENLNIIGVLWGGTNNKDSKNDQCLSGEYSSMNSFNWISIDNLVVDSFLPDVNNLKNKYTAYNYWDF